MEITAILVTVGGIIIGGGATFAIFGKRKIIDFEKREEDNKKMIEKSEEESRGILSKTKGDVQRYKERGEEERVRIKKHIDRLEAANKRKEDYVKKHEDRNTEVKGKVEEIEKHTGTIQDKTIQLEKDITVKIAAKAGTTVDKEHEALLTRTRRQKEDENKAKLGKLEEQLFENSEKEAREILLNIMQRLASPTSVEKRGIEVKVKKDAVKAEIVGENAENISYIEEALDIYVVFNDLPNIISVSCYNLLNQHIAAKAIEKLTNAKGHVKIGDVGEVIKVAKKEVENELEKIGKDIADKLGLKNRSKRLYELIGRLKYRTSYGQNILKHSLEVAYVSMMLGGELGLNVEVCKVGGFLHDLGKAIDQDPNVQEGHDFLTKKLMEELGFSPEEVHAAWTHHEAEAPQTPEAKVVMAADAVSAGRPGARQETLDKYLERLRALEEIANSFAGVKKSFAISAGREIRVIVDPQEVDDAGVQKTATGLAKQIEENLQYPGKIKINVIRRVKALDTAK